MGQALYRRYRTTTLAETAGQEHITQALQHALDTNRVSHAYLFTGPRGVGKTSVARIMAYAINGIPYSTEPNLDIIEIDAASNRRIDEIRDLRDKVHIAPASSKYKVYIIDEVHMLTREAFNALLKTLEEPPAHVIFILATTDSHKLPETIVSRTQRYNFKPIDSATAVTRLKHIAKLEKITISDDALQLLAEHGGGSFRDSISLLDQVSNQAADIDIDAVRAQLGIPPTEALQELVTQLQSNELSAPVQTLQKLYDSGYRAASIADQLSALIRDEISSGNTSLSLPNSLLLLEKLLDVPAAHNPERFLEIITMQVITPSEAVIPMRTAIAAPEPSPIKIPEPAAPVVAMPEPTAEPRPAKRKPASGPVLDDKIWTEVLATLKKQYNTLYGIVRMAGTDFSEPGKITLSFGFAFHQKRISDPKNRKIVADTIEEVTGQQIELVCIVSKETNPVAAKAPAKDSMQDINDVFGGGELL